MRILNSCDELIEFVMNELSEYSDSVVMFQGDVLEIDETDLSYEEFEVVDVFGIDKTDLSYEEFGVIKNDTLISISSSTGSDFDLHAIKGFINFEKSYPCVVVPNYMRNGLIAALKGEW